MIDTVRVSVMRDGGVVSMRIIKCKVGHSAWLEHGYMIDHLALR